MQASNGNIYFVNSSSGNIVGLHGQIYEFNPVTRALTIRHHFNDQFGSVPFGSLIEYSPGLLYGIVRYFSGSDSLKQTGGIFTFNLDSNTYTFKQSYFSIGQRQPGFIVEGGLTRFGNKLYGTTWQSGNGF